jgi:hypothetical protein
MKNQLLEILVAVKVGKKSIPDAQNEIMSLLDIEKRKGDIAFMGNVCLSYRHDFGLLSFEEKTTIMLEYSEWMRAIINNLPYTQ